MAEPISIDLIKEIAQQYGYWAVFFGISLENAGVPLPGETITIVGGFLAGEGELQYSGVLGSAIAGAIVGDNFGYWLGKWGGWPLVLRIGQLFRVETESLDSLRSQFGANAAKAVFFGRFIALLRVFAGPLAGITNMPYSQFFLCNAAGAVLWALAMVTLAFTVGRIVPLEELLEYVSQFAVAALIIVVAAFVVSNRLAARRSALVAASDAEAAEAADAEGSDSEATPTSVGD